MTGYMAATEELKTEYMNTRCNNGHAKEYKRYPPSGGYCSMCRKSQRKQTITEQVEGLKFNPPKPGPPTKYTLSCGHDVLYRLRGLPGSALYCYRCEDWVEQEVKYIYARCGNPKHRALKARTRSGIFTNCSSHWRKKGCRDIVIHFPEGKRKYVYTGEQEVKR